MVWLPGDDPEIIDHRDEVEVRLHGGSRHGEIIAVPLARHQVILHALPKLDDWWSDVPLAPPPEAEQYQRHKFGFYDEVDHTVHFYDYWLAVGLACWVAVALIKAWPG